MCAGFAILLAQIHAFLDRILMRARKCGEDQVTGIRMAVGHMHTRNTLIRCARMLQIAKVELGVDALCVEVQRNGYDVEISSAFAVAEKRAFDAIRASH